MEPGPALTENSGGIDHGTCIYLGVGQFLALVPRLTQQSSVMLAQTTFGHIAEWCAAGNVSADRPDAGLLRIPNMAKLGLGKAAELATGKIHEGTATTAAN